MRHANTYTGTVRRFAGVALKPARRKINNARMAGHGKTRTYRAGRGDGRTGVIIRLGAEAETETEMGGWCEEALGDGDGRRETGQTWLMMLGRNSEKA